MVDDMPWHMDHVSPGSSGFPRGQPPDESVLELFHYLSGVLESTALTQYVHVLAVKVGVPVILDGNSFHAFANPVSYSTPHSRSKGPCLSVAQHYRRPSGTFPSATATGCPTDPVVYWITALPPTTRLTSGEVCAKGLLPSRCKPYVDSRCKPPF